jgi:hypothetical protein
VPEIRQFCMDISVALHVLSTVKKINKAKAVLEKSPYNKERFRVISKELKECSSEALYILMFEKLIRSILINLVEAYLDVNLKEKWKSERQWLVPLYIRATYGNPKLYTIYLHKEPREVTERILMPESLSNPKREKFNEIVDNLFHELSLLRMSHLEFEKIYTDSNQDDQTWLRPDKKSTALQESAYNELYDNLHSKHNKPALDFFMNRLENFPKTLFTQGARNNEPIPI